MTSSPYWRLLQDCARKLTAEGRTPFTRQDLIACVRQTKPDAKSSSLNPMIQGIAVNVKGGAPGGIGKRILWLVGYGRYELYQGQDGEDTDGPGSALASAASTSPTPEPRPRTISTPSPDSYSGDSSAQRRAEDWLATEASVVLGPRLEKRRFAVADGAILEVDGCCAEPPILCEIWAHIGPPKSAQKHKVMTDALKLVYLRETLVSGALCPRPGRCGGGPLLPGCELDGGVPEDDGR